MGMFNNLKKEFNDRKNGQFITSVTTSYEDICNLEEVLNFVIENDKDMNLYPAELALKSIYYQLVLSYYHKEDDLKKILDNPNSNYLFKDLSELMGEENK